MDGGVQLSARSSRAAHTTRKGTERSSLHIIPSRNRVRIRKRRKKEKGKRKKEKKKGKEKQPQEEAVAEQLALGGDNTVLLNSSHDHVIVHRSHISVRHLDPTYDQSTARWDGGKGGGGSERHIAPGKSEYLSTLPPQASIFSM